MPHTHPRGAGPPDPPTSRDQDTQISPFTRDGHTDRWSPRGERLPDTPFQPLHSLLRRTDQDGDTRKVQKQAAVRALRAGTTRAFTLETPPHPQP